MTVDQQTLTTQIIRSGFPRRGAAGLASAILAAAPQGGGGGGGITGYTQVLGQDAAAIDGGGGSSRLQIPTWTFNRDAGDTEGPEVVQGDEFFDVVEAGWYCVRIGGLITWNDETPPAFVKVAAGGPNNQQVSTNFPVVPAGGVPGQSRASCSWELTQSALHMPGWTVGDGFWRLGPWIQWAGAARDLFNKYAWAEVTRIG